MERFRVVTAVGEKRVGRIVDSQGQYFIVKRSLGRGRYPLPKEKAKVIPEERLVLMSIPRRDLFAAPKVHRDGQLDPATDGYYNP